MLAIGEPLAIQMALNSSSEFVTISTHYRDGDRWDCFVLDTINPSLAVKLTTIAQRLVINPDLLSGYLAELVTLTLLPVRSWFLIHTHTHTHTHL